MFRKTLRVCSIGFALTALALVLPVNSDASTGKKKAHKSSTTSTVATKSSNSTSKTTAKTSGKTTAKTSTAKSTTKTKTSSTATSRKSTKVQVASSKSSQTVSVSTSEKTQSKSKTAKATFVHSKSPVIRAEEARAGFHRSGQLQPTQERYQEIEQALVDRGYLNSAADGKWGTDSVAAMKKFQEDQRINADGKIGALALTALGLGPKRQTATVAVVPTQTAGITPLD